MASTDDRSITDAGAVTSMYDSMVEQYKEMTSGELELHGYKDKLRWLAENCQGAVLLDVGCGHGYMLQWLLEEHKVPSSALGGHDLSAEMLEDARKVLPGVRLTQGNCTDVANAGWSGAGGVMCQFVIQHLERHSEMPSAIRAFSSVLKQGGALLMGFWAGEGTSSWGPTVTGNLFSREEMTAALAAAGFADMEFEMCDTEQEYGMNMSFIKAVKK